MSYTHFSLLLEVVKRIVLFNHIGYKAYCNSLSKSLSESEKYQGTSKTMEE